MSNRADDIRRRHKERKKQMVQSSFHTDRQVYHSGGSGEGEDPTFYHSLSEENPSEEHHPLLRKERVIFRLMAAAVLFLGVGVLFKNPSHALDQERAFVRNTFNHEFQFAMVSNWYQKQFGVPLALFPKSNSNKMKASSQSSPGYAVPVNGTVTRNFSDTGQKGVLFQTSTKASVKAVKQGYVTYVGTKKGLGKTVIVQLPDGTEAWYGELANVDVKQYDFVSKGEKIGTVTPMKNGKSGKFFFALKKNHSFVNPLKVIHLG